MGGEARKVGKTTVVCRLIRGFPDIEWTAVKISGHDHGLAPGAWSLTAEKHAGHANDTQRYLAAGAAHALWLSGDAEAALPALRERLARAPHWIVESTRAAAWLEHDFSILVTDAKNGEKKASAQGFRAKITINADDPHLVERVIGYW
ncbi:MAG: hypothetical protein KJZ84_03030 [Bryobacteraceae bacterium]|nr:hypothetical protein [Bryobacteraceae bacterium]